MKKKSMVISSIVALIVILGAAFYLIGSKEKSLAHDLLSEVDFSKVKVNAQISKSDNISEVSVDDSKEILQLLQKMNVKKKHVEGLKDYSILIASGGGGSFQIFLYDQGYIKIPTQTHDDLYKVTESNEFEKLLHIVEKNK
ncbi:hypothetical protein KZO01_02210 [Kurthia zopfii]|uniref:Uncharacterized protein n=1 Tax=Kurthia zopfii TaxID=1650 RepID=A0A2U3AFF9_9BACL|nr:hypothetical protein [Kurthia zopfii]PWI23288.1 hypothetical protein DF281_03225 [Kurthia zopfii]TDR42151.1 hypothetical protein DFR61_10441 [Kurthia zopfii]STX10930.1 Uncharacterised protein [Kurthia zopfii]VEI05698.1 Uncharacterised protein [Kurthia zopfii]GEK29912.1 hypothetical protein KZO01_02210 [Kurthia zopfii]